MAGRGEFLYGELNDRAAIDGLINEPEDGHLDCKEWPAKGKDAHEMLAKAICGLTNSDGGVLVIGMQAKSQRSGAPDVITDFAPVPDTSQVRSRILTLVGNLVEPPIVGVESREIAETIGSKSGFVIVFVPRSEGPPHRSRKDSRFYIRVGSVTLPMEYWQIEERFGSRPHARLELYLEQRFIGLDAYRKPTRSFVLGLTNSGAGIAKFPGVLFERSLGLSVNSFGIDGSFQFGIRLRPSESGWIIFGGGVDDVIYPGQTVMIAKLEQDGQSVGIKGIPGHIQIAAGGREIKARYVFKELHFRCEISCEGCQTSTVEKVIPEADSIVDI
ncbi:MAG: helix-turn-helix domain-containing protein [Terracidiphilus sp.]